MKSRSAKNKGARLQNELKQKLEAKFPEFRQGDIKTAIMGESGTDIVLSPHARDEIPFDFECKNQEKLSIWAALKQAEANSERVPAVVFKRNRSKTYIVVELDEFLKMDWNLNEDSGQSR